MNIKSAVMRGQTLIIRDTNDIELKYDIIKMKIMKTGLMVLARNQSGNLRYFLVRGDTIETQPVPKFTREQEDWICWMIGEWYLDWKSRIANYEQKTHSLGYAKEQLKELICADWNEPILTGDSEKDAI